MSRSVRWGSPEDGGSHYEHQRSDSGVGSFSDCESRTSNPDRNFLVSGYEDNNTIYSLQRALQEARTQRDEFAKKITELENQVRQTRGELEQTKAHIRAVQDKNELLVNEKETLVKENKDLSDKNTELQEQLDDSAKELKKANRKSTNSPTVTIVTSTSSESSDDKKLRRSSSKRRPEKEKERDAEREKERRDKERRKEKQREKEKEKEREKDEEEIERLRRRFEGRAGDESDAKSSIASSKTIRSSRRDSYIEPMGHSAPRPQQAVVPPSPARHHSYTTSNGYPPSSGYPSIREPAAYAPGAPRSVHPQVYVPQEYTGYTEEEEAPYHAHTRGRVERR
ncbi:hypothetical protein QBC35DRAFT_477002 [Podospora australis]|uniref:Uncharacterized protein n=1 Tax=Podospora australis TaxID=1536484 RepID=A0AAN6WMT1_9PEZI|nr:hypothetical protein QBC35DRAFT_477002 [Podospora australis]